MRAETSPEVAPDIDAKAAHRRAFLDWLACASAGRGHPAARAAEHAGVDLGDRVVAVGTAGHVLDFDDTYLPGLAHLSAPVAPAALVLGAEVGATVGAVLDAYATGFEAMGALARASHPAIYDRGFHATSVCGVVGAATASSLVLGLDLDATSMAVRLALLRAGGLRGAFGSHGKSLQVAMAASTGVSAAKLAGAGARVPPDLSTRPAGFEEAYAATWREPSGEGEAVAQNWIKAYPCCLQTHSAIEAAAEAREARARIDSGATITVHPLSRQAAAYDDVDDELQAKFSIPYTAAFSFLRRPPTIEDFDGVDRESAALARRITVHTDASLLESEARLETSEGFSTRVEAALGSPARPMDDVRLEAKVRTLAGESLIGVLDDRDAPAASILEAAGLGCPVPES
ncbi:MAG: MmgE/PrpD family protein [Actinomycetota bacterium]